MGAFVSIPFTTGHQTILIGGVLINFEYSLDGKGVITLRGSAARPAAAMYSSRYFSRL
jgi:hypothetical protein